MSYFFKKFNLVYDLYITWTSDDRFRNGLRLYFAVLFIIITKLLLSSELKGIRYILGISAIIGFLLIELIMYILKKKINKQKFLRSEEHTSELQSRPHL